MNDPAIYFAGPCLVQSFMGACSAEIRSVDGNLEMSTDLVNVTRCDLLSPATKMSWEIQTSIAGVVALSTWDGILAKAPIDTIVQYVSDLAEVGCIDCPGYPVSAIMYESAKACRLIHPALLADLNGWERRNVQLRGLKSDEVLALRLSVLSDFHRGALS